MSTEDGKTKTENRSGIGHPSSVVHRPYFSTPERIEALKNQLQQWAGTRWAHAGNRPNEMRCGLTGDCLFWVKAFKAVGALPTHIEIPAYRKMEAAADDMRLLRDRIMGTGRAELIWERDFDRPVVWREVIMPLPMIGDVLLFKNGMSGVHCGLCVKPWPPHFVHLSRNGFLEEPMNQGHWLETLAYVYRLMEADCSRESHSRLDVPEKVSGLQTEARA